MNPEPLKDLLARMKPKEAGLDRDALLFEAGRESVRPSPFWKAVAAGLATSQAATLLFLLPLALPTPSSSPAYVEAKPPAGPWVDPTEYRSDPWIRVAKAEAPHGMMPCDSELPPLPGGEPLIASGGVPTVFAAEAGLRASPGLHAGLWD